MLFLDYLPAELKDCKSRCFVQYHVKNPKTGKLHRKTIKVNRIKNTTERKRFARKLILEINRKLESGWNPFLEQEAPRAYTKLIDALEIYLNAKRRELTSPDSIRTYVSQVSMFASYVKEVLKATDMPVISFDSLEVRKYMDYIYNEKNIHGVTYNNYKNKLVSVWNWFIENLYCKSNPFLSVKKKKEATKARQIIDFETRKQIKNYLLKENKKEFLAMVMLCFHGLLRPIEICKLLPEYINFEKRIIFLPAKITKDNEDRIVSMSDELFNCLQDLKINEIPKNYYIFSTGWKPGQMLKNARYIGKEWDKMRTALKMPAEYVFYSLKDSGIVQKLQDGINPLAVRDQAGHASLEQTNAYAKYVSKGSSEIKTKSSEF